MYVLWFSDDDDESQTSLDTNLVDNAVVIKHLDGGDTTDACLACSSLVKTALKHCSAKQLQKILNEN